MKSESHTDPEIPSRAQCSELLEKICSSTELKRATRLRDFLRYVGQRSLDSDNIPISEHEIGTRVFERRENYDTSADNIVRVNASELRKRIAAYYATEGANEKILLEIPLRSYTPQFRIRTTEPVASSEVLAPSPVPVPSGATPSSGPAASVRSLWKWLLPYAGYALSLVLAAICLYLFQHNKDLQNQLNSWRNEPTLGAFWSGFLDSSRQTDIVVADTSFSLVEDILKKSISLSDYLNHSYIEQIQSSNLTPELKSDLEIVASRHNASLGDFRVAQRILAFEPFSKHLQLQYSRDYRPSAIKTNNVILIGSSRSNPWSRLFDDRLNFVLDYDAKLNEMLIRNHRPLPGESTAYVVPVDPGNANGYSLIDYIPNEEHTADVLIIAGTTAEATEAAGEFLTSEKSLHSFQNRLHTRTLPYFELLLKTTKLVGTPLSAEVIAYRTFPDLSPVPH